MLPDYLAPEEPSSGEQVSILLGNLFADEDSSGAIFHC